MTEGSKSLAAKHRARALLCESRGGQVSDAATRREWVELAIEWHALANAAARLMGSATAI